jgi:hypothetical protein
VCGFLPPDQLAALAGQFRTIINNRPDGEEAGQAPSVAFDKAARASGMSAAVFAGSGIAGAAVGSTPGKAMEGWSVAASGWLPPSGLSAARIADIDLRRA